MCGIYFLLWFSFRKKTRIRFGMSLVRFSSKNAVRFGYYNYLNIIVIQTHAITNITATVDDMTLTSLKNNDK